ncbi:uncharacterized protein N7498_008135 [Penicillium cinerascens]|uniref:Uncharacterized protein n=1 Tax=Penicillium cinerascens TaxID=70096 RepID=A0A9W9JEU6_9EURO|nr:uncharacterized protein N7498_008135 [Penicillium cinerascens]KAJ5194697.1 hypothetical protein N7498_008135 [Penicillium cinerascens]
MAWRQAGADSGATMQVRPVGSDTLQQTVPSLCWEPGPVRERVTVEAIALDVARGDNVWCIGLCCLCEFHFLSLDCGLAEV